MQKNGVPIQYLSIANEPDWPHTQPGYFSPPEQHAALFKTVGDYLDKMAKKHPEVPRPKLVGPNTLSAPGAAKDYLPRVLKTAPGSTSTSIGSHDYDPRGDRWGSLRKLARHAAGLGDGVVCPQEGRLARHDQLRDGIWPRHARGIQGEASTCSWRTTGSIRRAIAARH